MAKKRKWLYTKDGRFYGDFRPYADVGGGQEAMKAEGERYATRDYRVARTLARERLRELKRLRQHGHAISDVDLPKGRSGECPVERIDVLLDLLDAQLESLELSEQDASLDERARTILMG